MSRNDCFIDVQMLRARARQRIDQGAVTLGYRADRDVVVRLLNEALATEIVCALRCRRHHFMATGIHVQPVAQHLLKYSSQEQAHADKIAERIVQLCGAPDFSPAGMLRRSHTEYLEGITLVDMIKEDLVAKRIVIDSYAEMVRFIGNDDPTTRRMLERILAEEEQQADELANLFQRLRQ